MKKIAVALGIVISVVLAFIAYQLAWQYWIQAQHNPEMFLYGYTNYQFYPIAYGSAAVTLCSALGIVTLLQMRSKNNNTETVNSLSRKQRSNLEEKWILFQKAGTPEQKAKFIEDHPAFFGIKQPKQKSTDFFGVNEAESAEQPFSSPLNSDAPASPPQPETVVTKGNEIIIKIPREVVQPPPPVKTENNGHNNPIENDMQQWCWEKVKDGTMQGKIKYEDGKFVIPEGTEFSFVKQKRRKQETSLAIPEKTKPKIPKVRP